MSAIVYRCDRTVYWYAENHTSRCILDAGHRGLLTDGLVWFDQHGLRQPQDQRRAAA